MALAIPASTWARRTFGAHADALRQAIPTALDRAWVRARTAHDSAEMTTLHTYGTTLWVAQHEELIRAIGQLGPIREAQLIGYRLVVLGSHAFFPLCYTDQATVPVERARLPKPLSPQRQQLYGAHSPAVDDPQLLLLDWTDPAPADRPRPLPELGADTQLITVAYACNLEAGLLRVEWGEAEHVGDGELRWGHHEPLPLPTDDQEPSRRLRPVGDTGQPGQPGQPERFGHGRQPDIGLDIRAQRQRALGGSAGH